MQSGIYKITNLVNGLVYIGATNNIKRRLREHKLRLSKNIHCNQHLQRSFNEYGIDNFRFDIIELCDETIIWDRELFWINKLDTWTNHKGYNIPTSRQWKSGWHHTPEAISSIRTSKLGKLRPDYVKQRCRESKNHSFKPVKGTHAQTGRMIEFQCLKDAEKVGFDRKSIRQSISGERTQHKGYRWQWLHKTTAQDFM